MRAAVFDKNGIENLCVKDVEKPHLSEGDVLVKVKTAGINPIDFFIVNGRHGMDDRGDRLESKPMPHIPGTEISGIVEKTGDKVKDLKMGDRVVVYNRLFDSECEQCLGGMEMLCENGGMIGLSTNGGFAEFVAVPAHNVMKIPDWIGWDLAASLPIAALTPFHALKLVGLGLDDWIVVLGASGNTGQFAVQFGKMMGAQVIALSSKEWVKDYLKADYLVTSYEGLKDEVEYITEGKFANVVLNSIGEVGWDQSVNSLGKNGRIVTFGVLTGGLVDLDLRRLYSNQMTLMGSTGGKRSELREIVNMDAKNLKVKVWKKCDLENASNALKFLFDKNRDGRILLKVD